MTLCVIKHLKFIVLLKGLLPGPRKFTKLTKPSIAFLRLKGQRIAI